MAYIKKYNKLEIVQRLFKKIFFSAYMHSKQKHSYPENQYEGQRLSINIKFYNNFILALQLNAYLSTAIGITTTENEKLGFSR
uniref:Uncharacterized protein n=1 Tax=Rhipicephalus appendiculatus TaxID=34631 RepID=A0A131YAM5_RHIAP